MDATSSEPFFPSPVNDRMISDEVLEKKYFGYIKNTLMIKKMRVNGMFFIDNSELVHRKVRLEVGAGP
jgi:hypothetical protein